MKLWIRLLCLPLLAIAASMVSAQNVTEISTVQQLKAFRDAVNAGNNYAGQTVKLTADLDLNGETWSPIGQEDTNVASSKNLDWGGAPVAHLFLLGALRAEIIQKFSLKINQKLLFILRLVMTSFY